MGHLARGHRESRAGHAGDGGHGEAVTRVDLARALGALTAKQRAVVVLRHFEDLSEREVATILGISVGTVKSQNHAALSSLRQIVPALTGSDGSAAERTPR